MARKRPSRPPIPIESNKVNRMKLTVWSLWHLIGHADSRRCLETDRYGHCDLKLEYLTNGIGSLTRTHCIILICFSFHFPLLKSFSINVKVCIQTIYLKLYI